SDCHGFHRILPASDAKSSVSRANLVSTCQKCHPKANANFVRFSPHADPNDKARNPGLYYIAGFMNILVFGVFLFFGLHTALWLFRSTLEVWRRRKSPGEPEGGQDPDEGGGKNGT
ncbi:MAG: hypothetical protein HYY81_08700, partial [Deltaproteobacteria bacterium]|nr:hypothetical protein [Deltaproteobacteria bacterium]